MVLLNKVIESEDLVQRAEQYYDEQGHTWSPGLAAYFRDLLERKKDQIHYEWYRVNKMGMEIASKEARSISDILSDIDRG